MSYNVNINQFVYFQVPESCDFVIYKKSLDEGTEKYTKRLY